MKKQLKSLQSEIKEIKNPIVRRALERRSHDFIFSFLFNNQYEESNAKHTDHTEHPHSEYDDYDDKYHTEHSEYDEKYDVYEDNIHDNSYWEVGR